MKERKKDKQRKKESLKKKERLKESLKERKFDRKRHFDINCFLKFSFNFLNEILKERMKVSLKRSTGIQYKARNQV